MDFIGKQKKSESTTEGGNNFFSFARLRILGNELVQPVIHTTAHLTVETSGVSATSRGKKSASVCLYAIQQNESVSANDIVRHIEAHICGERRKQNAWSTESPRTCR